MVKKPPVNAGEVGLIPGSEDPWMRIMVTYSRILAWRILWIEEPGRLQSMRSQRVVHDLVTEHALWIFIAANSH